MRVSRVGTRLAFTPPLTFTQEFLMENEKKNNLQDHGILFLSGEIDFAEY